MPRYDPKTSRELLGDNHRLRISVSPTGSESLIPDDELHARIVRDINQRCQPQFQVYYSIWTPEFFGGMQPLINYERSAETEAYAEKHPILLDGGRFKASIWLPAQLIRANANARGRPRAREKVVESVADALATVFMGRRLVATAPRI